VEGRTEFGTQKRGTGLMSGAAQNRLDNEIGRGGGKAKFARYWETLRTSRPVSRGYSFIVGGEFATIPFAPLHHVGFPKHAGSPIAFLRHGGIYRSDKVSLLTNLAQGAASRWSGPSQVKERAGRLASRPSSAMSSGRLFLDRVARQHCPSPLHRQAQTNMRFSAAWAKGDISTLPAGGHFYFALTLPPAA
jgi:hypothetical protein